MERRIAAIVAADMVGFSRLMEGGEADILTRQRTYFSEVFRPLFEVDEVIMTFETDEEETKAA